MFTFLNDTPVNLGLLKALSDFQTKFNIDYLNIGVIDANKKYTKLTNFVKLVTFSFHICRRTMLFMLPTTT